MSGMNSVSSDVQAKERMAALEQYASATFTKVLTSQNDLDPQDRVMDEMLAWCKEQGNIVVTKSATILSSDPTSRTVQNCKSFMLSKGMHPGQVFASQNPDLPVQTVPVRGHEGST